MKKVINIMLIMFVVWGAVVQAKTARERKKDKKNEVQATEYYPFEPTKKNIPAFVQEERFKMNVKKEEYEEILEKKDKFRKILNSTLGMEILQKPTVKQIKTIDMIYIHPSYISTIILPEGSEISFAKASFVTPEAIFFDKNVLNIRPEKNFLNGNVIVYYTKERKNYHLNLILKNYRTATCIVDEIKKEFICQNSGFSLVYDYEKEKKKDDIDILFAYADLVNNNMGELNERGFAKVIYENELYYIIRDEKFGSIFYKGGKYRVAKKM